LAKPRNMNLPAECQSVSEILARVGDKWTVLVVSLLGAGPMRFSELRRKIDGISQKMLTTTLRGLERDGFCTRKVFPTVPPRVEYALTELGRDLLVPVKALGDWAVANRERVDAARRRFDARKAAGPAPAREGVLGTWLR
jgi:DNA-binding HxlR family transcriptional regulator